MPLPAESPFRATRADRRALLSAHLVKAIEPLLEDTSYSDMSVQQIISTGGISRTAFYAYFTDKADLLKAMAEDVITDLTDVAFWQLPPEASQEDLRAALSELITVYRTHRPMLRAVVQATAYDSGMREMYDSIVERGVRDLTAHIELGQRSGTIEPSLRPAGTAKLLIHMLQRSLYEVIGLENELSDEAFLDPLTAIFWRTLYAGYR